MIQPPEERRGRSKKMTIELTNGNKITGNAITLNYISMALTEAAENCRRKGLPYIASNCEHDSDIIYRVLKEKGVYATK